MLLLLKTFIDILALRKGPDSIPRSWLVLAVALLLMATSSCAAVVLVAGNAERNYAATFSAYGLGLCFYGAVVYLAGYPARLMQTITTIIACGSLITLLFVAEFTLFTPLLGKETAGFIASLIVFWSVPVEGHIMSRAIERHWLIGIGIAILALVLQYGMQAAMTAQA